MNQFCVPDSHDSLFFEGFRAAFCGAQIIAGAVVAMLVLLALVGFLVFFIHVIQEISRR